MEARTPDDPYFNPYNNPYNKKEYQRLLNEFYARPNDILEIDQPARGLGYNFKAAAGEFDLKTYARPPYPTFPSTGNPNEYSDVQKSGGN